MTDTIWCDVAEFQKPVDDSYPYRVLSIREGDGTYKDAHFTNNYNWCVANVGKKLDFFIIYIVYEPGKDWVGNVTGAIGKANSRMAVMVDVESWGGKITGNHSADINAGVMKLAAWLGSLKRVIGYGNASDLNSIWPSKVLAPNHIVLANYVGNPSFPNKFAHQYSDDGNVSPFGSPVDLNSADGYDIPSLLKLLGMTGSAISGSAPAAPKVPTNKDGSITIAEDGNRGPQTIARWEEVMDTPEDGVISNPSTLIKADQTFLNSVVSAEDIKNLTGKTALVVDGIEGANTIKVRQFWLYNKHCIAVLKRNPTASDFDGILGHDTNLLHQVALNAATSKSKKY